MAPMDFLRQMRDYYTKGPEPAPPLSTHIVAYLSIAFTLLYVLPFYLHAATRPSPHLSRDAPAVIRARVQLVSLSCAGCALVTIYVLTQYVHASRDEVLRLLGWWPVGVPEIGRAGLLTALLFAGPLFERGVVEGGWRGWISGRVVVAELRDWVGWRNYVAGPLTEEFLFRSLLTPLALLTPTAPTRTLFLTPLYFGLAHAHHCYEFRLTHPRVPLAPALLRTLAQFAYTTLFGWYANFVFVRTGSLPAVVLAHAFCNAMGLPRVWGRLEAQGGVLGPEVPRAREAWAEERRRGGAKRKNSEEDSLVLAGVDLRVAEGRLGVGWTVSYYALLVAGAVAFWWGLWPLTESERRLAELR